MPIQRALGNIGPVLTNPQLPAPGTPPPDPSQVGLWQKFQQRLANDPNLRMALLTTGLNLFRTPERGRSSFDVFADATTTGVGTLDQLRARERAEGRQDTRIGLEERRTATTEERTDIARTGVEQRGEALDATLAQREVENRQRGEQIQVARDRLNEVKRQFDVERTEGATPSGTTGQERMVDLGIDALVTANPEEFPNTPEGKAKARLVVQGIGPTGTDPSARARGTIALFTALVQNNTYAQDPVSNEVLRDLAIDLYDTFAGEGEETAGTGDPLDGTTLVHPVNGTGTVRLVGPDRYIVEFPGGNTGEVSAAQIQAMQGGVTP